MNDEQDLLQSVLSQVVTRDGKSVALEIYGDGDGRWILEAVDEHGNPTVWDQTFSSEQDALDEALNTIDTEGIDTLIGEASSRPEARDPDGSLSETEFAELDDFLARPEIEASSMDVATLEGFLVAITIGPKLVTPSAWLPWVWDMDHGERWPKFDSEQQASQIMSLLMRMYNGVVDAFASHPDEAFQPVFYKGGPYGVAEWCTGFLTGFTFDHKAWSMLMAAQPTWFTAFMRLGTEEGRELIDDVDDAAVWTGAIEPSLRNIHAYWLARRPSGAPGAAHPGHGAGVTLVRAAPKLGRNDPCPCGSGKKFKKCCGANGTVPGQR